MILVTGWAKAGGISGRVLAVYRGILKYAPKVSPAPKVWGGKLLQEVNAGCLFFFWGGGGELNKRLDDGILDGLDED